MMQKKTTYRQDVLSYVREKYGTAPDYPWMSTPDAAVLRHKDNKKWYGLIMNIRRDRLGLEGTDNVDILNVKCDPLMTGSLLMMQGILPAYHMNKKSWISVLLDGTAEHEQIYSLIDMSFTMTDGKTSGRKGKTGK